MLLSSGEEIEKNIKMDLSLKTICSSLKNVQREIQSLLKILLRQCLINFGLLSNLFSLLVGVFAYRQHSSSGSHLRFSYMQVLGFVDLAEF